MSTLPEFFQPNRVSSPTITAHGVERVDEDLLDELLGREPGELVR